METRGAAGPEGGTLAIRTLLGLMFGPERAHCWLAVIYGVAVGILTLAVPLCVQVLVSSVANIATLQPVVVLSLVLFVLLLFSGLLVALQTYVMDLFERRFFCRVTAEIVLRYLHARQGYLESINREELVNRYFEIMTVQKNLPKLLLGGTALMLQATVGLVVVSVYHPFFLFYNLALAAIVYLLVRLWAGRALRTATEVSEAKYRVARWLEELARANTFFKGERRLIEALDRSDALSADYIGRHTRHFRVRFVQILGLLLLYALASAVLLGLGGWLVVTNQLTLGQLVAAELILATIFAGMSRFGDYLEDYYELRAALDKLSYFSDMPLATEGGEAELPPGPVAVRFDRTAVRHRTGEFVLEFALTAGGTYMAAAQSSRLQKAFLDLLQRYREPDGGQLTLSGLDVLDCRPQALRDRIALVDGTGALERTVGEYLAVGEPSLSRSRMREALAAVALAETVDSLERGLDTQLGPTGYPLSRTETLRLNLAAALLRRPALLVITEVFDSVPSLQRRRILRYLRQQRAITVVFFTNRRDVEDFDRFLFLGVQSQPVFDTLEGLLRHEESLADRETLPPTRPAWARERG